MEKIVVFGCGRYWKLKKEKIMQTYEIVAHIDNMVKPGESSVVNGIPVYNPKDVDMYIGNRILIMSSRFYEMTEQLLALHISIEKIILGVNFAPAYDNGETLLHQNNITISLDKDGFFASHEGERIRLQNESAYQKYMRTLFLEERKELEFFKEISFEPLSRRFGFEHGTPLDRRYIEQFLAENRQYITGDVVEIADNEYTRKYGTNYCSYVLHVNGAGGTEVIKGNFETGEGIEENFADCIICTQTLQMIFNTENAIKNIYKMLKPGGTLLLTGHGISQISLYDYINWGEYWRFTKKSLSVLLGKHFAEDEIKVSSYGNVKVSMAFLYGLACEDLDEEIFSVNDEQYQLVVCGVAHKKK